MIYIVPSQVPPYSTLKNLLVANFWDHEKVHKLTKHSHCKYVQSYCTKLHTLEAHTFVITFIANCTAFQYFSNVTIIDVLCNHLAPTSCIRCKQQVMMHGNMYYCIYCAMKFMRPIKRLVYNSPPQKNLLPTYPLFF